ncbi:X-ray repair cross-complementing protein 5 isoform X1 [Carcharodon carcharias]|uniref:X-ray repair cross-complementing protein 5 isoform X1 n=2 Tax=Carcharodon carcharias TaxID=13397 RepID=UPI001B7E5795|nr:X-ray repair cross-complementing protein 5 isoform X1 [Carcharodon carcharias]
MARSCKSAIVLCWDVGCTTSNSPLGEDTPFKQAQKVVLMFVQRQVFAESKDETALVLFGTDGTSNPLATSDQYQNITVRRNLMIPDFGFLEDVQSSIRASDHQADFLDALIVCMDLLQKQTIGKKYEKLHIAVFTDLNSPFSSDQLDAITSSMKKFGITLQFFLPFPLDATSAGGGGDAAERHWNASSGKELTAQQKEGIRMVRKVMLSLDEEGGLDEVFTFRESVERLSIFKKIERKPMAWPCQLTIGSRITINIVGYKAMTEEKVKKSWMSVDAKTLRKEDVRRETVYCLNDDNETEVPKEDTIQGFRYGSDIIPFSQVDQEQMKYKTDGKCFSVLGFTKSSQILRHYYVGRQVLQVFAAKDDEHASVALSALLHALEELDMVAIVRYVYDRRSNPQVGVAFPVIKDKYECLAYIQLPFTEDLRQFTFTSLKNNKKGTVSEEQLSAVDALINSMSLVVDDGEEMEDLFKVSRVPNPHFQRLFQGLHYKAFQPDKPLPPIDSHLMNMLNRPKELAGSCQASLEQLKKLFTLQDSGKKKEQKIAQQIFKDNEVEELGAKRARSDEDFNIVTLAEGNVTTVGSLTPAKDFQALLHQKNSTFREATKQLMERVYQFLEVKNREYYMKSMNCIKVCREEAGKAGESELFNMLLKTLKENVEAKGLQDFWELIVQDTVTLISKDEAAESTVTIDEAKQFLAPEERTMEEAAVPEDDGDVDDLLDMM